jgi:hypothetical protein
MPTLQRSSAVTPEVYAEPLKSAQVKLGPLPLYPRKPTSSADQHQRDTGDGEQRSRHEAFSRGSSVTGDLGHDPPIQSYRRMSALVRVPDASRTSCED